MKLTWLGHASWLIETGNGRVILDPFLNDNPAAKLKARDIQGVGHVLISHGHFDHVADAAEIANGCGATLVANYEIAQWFSRNHSVASTIGMNIGGAVELEFGKIKLVPAIHSSSLPDGTYGGVAGGFLIEADGKRIYFACDTSLFTDMGLIGAGGLHAAILPIGDLYTMGIEDSVAAVDLLKPKAVLPTHYGTWPPIEQDPVAWSSLVRKRTQAEPIVLEVGGSYTVKG